MTVEPQSYRIERFDPDPKTEPVKFSSGETFLVDFEDGYAVVKDSRLQAIADAWNSFLTQMRTKGGHSGKAYRELARLLNVLTEDDETPPPNPGQYTQSPMWDALTEENDGGEE